MNISYIHTVVDILPLMFGYIPSSIYLDGIIKGILSYFGHVLQVFVSDNASFLFHVCLGYPTLLTSCVSFSNLSFDILKLTGTHNERKTYQFEWCGFL